MQTKIHIAAFAGSLRKNSYNQALIDQAAKMIPAGAEIEIIDLSPIPLYNQDMEQTGFPTAVVTFREKLHQANAFLIATPEYNSSIPGVLKNALDWASRGGPEKNPPMSGKPLAIIGVGGRFGTSRAQHHLRQVASHMNMFTLPKPEVLISNFPQKVFDEANTLTDEFALKLMQEQLIALVDLTRQLNQPITQGLMNN